LTTERGKHFYDEVKITVKFMGSNKILPGRT